MPPTADEKETTSQELKKDNNDDNDDVDDAQIKPI